MGRLPVISTMERRRPGAPTWDRMSKAVPKKRRLKLARDVMLANHPSPYGFN